MNRTLETLGAIFLGAIMLVGLFTWTRAICMKIDKVKVVQEKVVSTIDSVWLTSPGQENTLQTDYRYYGKASNGQVIVSTDKAFHIGDSIVCIYHRYETIKTKEKQ
jgi:hypothetical protein